MRFPIGYAAHVAEIDNVITLAIAPIANIGGCDTELLNDHPMFERKLGQYDDGAALVQYLRTVISEDAQPIYCTDIRTLKHFAMLMEAGADDLAPPPLSLHVGVWGKTAPDATYSAVDGAQHYANSLSGAIGFVGNISN